MIITPNTNLASNIHYKTVFSRIPNVIFNCQSVRIPGITFGSTVQHTPFKSIPLPGNGSIQYGSFSMSFLINEDYSNWLEICNWMKGLGPPDSFDQHSTLESSREGLVSDFSVIVYDSKNRPKSTFEFVGGFPTELGSIDYDSRAETEENIVCETSFTFVSFSLTAP